MHFGIFNAGAGVEPESEGSLTARALESAFRKATRAGGGGSPERHGCLRQREHDVGATGPLGARRHFLAAPSEPEIAAGIGAFEAPLPCLREDSESLSTSSESEAARSISPASRSKLPMSSSESQKNWVARERLQAHEAKLSRLQREIAMLSQAIKSYKRKEIEFVNHMHELISEGHRNETSMRARVDHMADEQRELRDSATQGDLEGESLRSQVEEMTKYKRGGASRVQNLMDTLVNLLSQSSTGFSCEDLLSDLLRESTEQAAAGQLRLSFFVKRLEEARQENRARAQRLSDMQVGTTVIHEKMCTLQTWVWERRLLLPVGEGAEPIVGKSLAFDDAYESASDQAVNAGRGSEKELDPAELREAERLLGALKRSEAGEKEILLGDAWLREDLFASGGSLSDSGEPETRVRSVSSRAESADCGRTWAAADGSGPGGVGSGSGCDDVLSRAGRSEGLPLKAAAHPANQARNGPHNAASARSPYSPPGTTASSLRGEASPRSTSPQTAVRQLEQAFVAVGGILPVVASSPDSTASTGVSLMHPLVPTSPPDPCHSAGCKGHGSFFEGGVEVEAPSSSSRGAKGGRGLESPSASGRPSALPSDVASTSAALSMSPSPGERPSGRDAPDGGASWLPSLRHPGVASNTASPAHDSQVTQRTCEITSAEKWVFATAEDLALDGRRRAADLQLRVDKLKARAKAKCQGCELKIARAGQRDASITGSELGQGASKARNPAPPPAGGVQREADEERKAFAEFTVQTEAAGGQAPSTTASQRGSGHVWVLEPMVQECLVRHRLERRLNEILTSICFTHSVVRVAGNARGLYRFGKGLSAILAVLKLAEDGQVMASREGKEFELLDRLLCEFPSNERQQGAASDTAAASASSYIPQATSGLGPGHEPEEIAEELPTQRVSSHDFETARRIARRSAGAETRSSSGQRSLSRRSSRSGRGSLPAVAPGGVTQVVPAATGPGGVRFLSVPCPTRQATPSAMVPATHSALPTDSAAPRRWHSQGTQALESAVAPSKLSPRGYLKQSTSSPGMPTVAGQAFAHDVSGRLSSAVHAPPLRRTSMPSFDSLERRLQVWADTSQSVSERARSLDRMGVPAPRVCSPPSDSASPPPRRGDAPDFRHAYESSCASSLLPVPRNPLMPGGSWSSPVPLQRWMPLAVAGPPSADLPIPKASLSPSGFDSASPRSSCRHSRGWFSVVVPSTTMPQQRPEDASAVPWAGCLFAAGGCDRHKSTLVPLDSSVRGAPAGGQGRPRGRQMSPGERML